MSSLTRHFGELMIDHRASPGLSEKAAHAIGLDGVPLGESTFNTVPTLGCNHCGGVVVLNPNRQRERGYCRLCDHYVCDICEGVRKEAGYIHRTIADIREAVASGKFTLAPGPTTRPILIPSGALIHV